MRKIFKIAITAIAFVLSLVAIVTGETILTELGWVKLVQRLIRDGWSAVGEAGFGDFIIFGAVLFTGATMALWADTLLRKLTDPKRKHHIVRLVCDFVDPKNAEWTINISDWISSKMFVQYTDKPISWRASDPNLTEKNAMIVLVFSEPIDGPLHVHVSSDREILWRINEKSNNHIALDIDLKNDDPLLIDIIVQNAKRFGQISGNELFKWDESFVRNRDKILENQNIKNLSSDLRLPERLTNPKSNLLTRLQNSIATKMLR
jgi:hypothetical protein